MQRFIGVDLHKEVVEVCAIDESGKRLFRRRTGCTREVLLVFAGEPTPNDAIALEVRTMRGQWRIFWSRSSDALSSAIRKPSRKRRSKLTGSMRRCLHNCCDATTCPASGCRMTRLVCCDS